MSLKNIKENYARLLTAFKEAGVKLTESQKKDLDGFILALNESMDKQKKITISATRKAVEKQLGKEYRKVFESIFTHMQENTELAAKIQKRITRVKESKKMAEMLDDYLTSALNEALPTEKIVDYNKMKRMETVLESLKDTLVINDESIAKKSEELTESFSKDKKELDNKIAALQKKLDESEAKTENLKKELSRREAKDYLTEKTKDLPLFEARAVRARLANASKEQIEKNFKKLLESIRQEMNEEDKEEEKTLEEEISEIIAKENDSSEKTDSDKKTETEPVDEDDEEDLGDEGEETDESDEDSEDDTLDEDDDGTDEDDGIELDESEQIPSYLMKQWIARSMSIKPIG